MSCRKGLALLVLGAAAVVLAAALAGALGGERTPAAEAPPTNAETQAIKDLVPNLLSPQIFEKTWPAIEEADRLVRARPAGADMSRFAPLIEPLFARANYGGIGDRHWKLAADVLVRVGKPAVPLLVRKLQSKNYHDRWSAMDILGRIGEPRELVISSARACLKDPDPDCRRVAAEALARLGADATKAAPGGDGGRSETQPPTDGGREVERKEPPGIAEVKSLAELRKCPPALREGGWELRLGLGDGGEAASDWRLLYCLASYVGHEAKPGSPKPVERMFGSASPLGPVSYRAREAGAQSEMEVQVRPNRVASVYVGQYGRRGEFVEELYSGTVPLVGKRDIRVQVFSRDIKLIAETVLPLKEEPPHHWQRLLAPQDDKGEGPPPPALILARPFAAVPSYSSFGPVWAAKRGDEERLTPKGQCLPGQLPPPFGYESRYLVSRPEATTALLPPADAEEAKRMPLGLTLADGQFVLETRCVVGLYEPADGLLARWWVNGRPVAAALAQDRLQEQQPVDKLLRALRQPPAPLRIPAALPQTLGPVKPGDKVALQVMYCPAGFKELGVLARRQELEKSGADCFLPAFQPLLSNRLEFEATKAMAVSR